MKKLNKMKQTKESSERIMIKSDKNSTKIYVQKTY